MCTDVAIRFSADPLDEVVEVFDMNTHFRYGGAAYVECEDHLEIIGLYICDQFRSLGIGTALMQFIFDHFKKDIKLGVLNENKAAQRFYARLGFVYLRRIRTGEAHFLIRRHECQSSQSAISANLQQESALENASLPMLMKAIVNSMRQLLCLGLKKAMSTKKN